MSSALIASAKKLCKAFCTDHVRYRAQKNKGGKPIFFMLQLDGLNITQVEVYSAPVLGKFLTILQMAHTHIAGTYFFKNNPTHNIKLNIQRPDSLIRCKSAPRSFESCVCASLSHSSQEGNKRTTFGLKEGLSRHTIVNVPHNLYYGRWEFSHVKQDRSGNMEENGDGTPHKVCHLISMAQAT